jgi:hypothetical protein
MCHRSAQLGHQLLVNGITSWSIGYWSVCMKVIHDWTVWMNGMLYISLEFIYCQLLNTVIFESWLSGCVFNILFFKKTPWCLWHLSDTDTVLTTSSISFGSLSTRLCNSVNFFCYLNCQDNYKCHKLWMILCCVRSSRQYKDVTVPSTFKWSSFKVSSTVLQSH